MARKATLGSTRYTASSAATFGTLSVGTCLSQLTIRRLGDGNFVSVGCWQDVERGIRL